MVSNTDTHGATDMTDSIRMRARYRDTCCACRQPVNVGDRIEWDRATRAVTCYACATKPAPQPDVLAWSERHEVVGGYVRQHAYHDETRYQVEITPAGRALPDDVLLARIHAEIERETRVRPWLGCSWSGHLVSLDVPGRTAVVAYCWPIGD